MGKAPNASQIRDGNNQPMSLEEAIHKSTMDSEKSYQSKADLILNPNNHLGNSRLINAPFIHIRKVQTKNNTKSPPPPSSGTENNIDKSDKSRSESQTDDGTYKAGRSGGAKPP